MITMRAIFLLVVASSVACQPAWELIATPRRSCARPSDAGSGTYYSAMFPTQDLQYSQVCGRIIGYQVGQPQAFISQVLLACCFNIGVTNVIVLMT
jgi:hypothetical protein